MLYALCTVLSPIVALCKHSTLCDLQRCTVAMQVIAWCMVFTLSVLIVASRKHYTVDVLIAWYVVPLVFYAMLRRWTTKRPLHEEPWPHRSLAEDNALQLEEVVVHGSIAAPEVTQPSLCSNVNAACDKLHMGRKSM